MKNIFGTEIFPEILVQFPAQYIDTFKTWLQSVPFDFSGVTKYSRSLSGVGGPGDIRRFFEPAIIVACWPIILRSSGSRPNIWILKLIGNSNVNSPNQPMLSTSPVSTLVFKALGVFGRIFESGLLDATSSDDWDVATTHIRRYVVCDGVSGFVLMDSK